MGEKFGGNLLYENNVNPIGGLVKKIKMLKLTFHGTVFKTMKTAKLHSPWQNLILHERIKIYVSNMKVVFINGSGN